MQYIWSRGSASTSPKRHWYREDTSCPGRANVFPFRDIQTFQPQEMINQIHFRRGLDWPKHDGAALSFHHGKGTAISKAALVPDFLRHHNLPFLRHVDYRHGRKLLHGTAYGNAKASRKI